MNYAILILAGALGALVKEILVDNKLTLPKKIEGELVLGFLGSLLIGAFAGWAIDGSPLTAAMAGFTSQSVIENLLPKSSSKNGTNKLIIEEMIRYIAKQEGVDPELAVKVAKCESALSPTAKNINTNGSVDRGLYQINSKWHPEISDQDAYDIILSTRFFCKAFKAGNLNWWDATRKCWEK